MTYEYEIRVLNYSIFCYPLFSMRRIANYINEIIDNSSPTFWAVDASRVYLFSRSTVSWINLTTDMKKQSQKSSLLVFYVKEKVTGGKQSKVTRGWTFYDGEMWTMSPLSSFKDLENDEAAAPRWIRDLMIEHKLKSTEAIFMKGEN